MAQRHLGGAQAVDGRIAAHRDARCGGVDDEQGQTIAVGLRAGKPRRDDELFRGVAVQDQSLGAVEHKTAAVAACRGCDIGEVVARLPFGVGEGKAELAGGDFRQYLGLHCLAAAKPDEAAAEHHGGEIGLEHQCAADLFHHDHGLDRPAA